MKDYTANINPYGVIDAMDLVRSLGGACGRCELRPTDLGNYLISVEKPISEEDVSTFEKFGVKILER